MNRILLTLLALVAMSPIASAAPDWADVLINKFKNNDVAEKQISINRDPDTRKVIRENYIFTFSGVNDFKTVRNELVKHSDEADYFEMTDGKRPRVTLRLTESSGRKSTFDIVLEDNGYKFTIYRADDAVSYTTTTSDAAAARREAMAARQKAQAERQKALKEAQRQRQEALRQRQEAQRQRQAAAKVERQKAQRDKRNQNSRGGLVVINADSAGNAAAARTQRDQLKRAEQARKRALGL